MPNWTFDKYFLVALLEIVGGVALVASCCFIAMRYKRVGFIFMSMLWVSGLLFSLGSCANLIGSINRFEATHTATATREKE